MKYNYNYSSCKDITFYYYYFLLVLLVFLFGDEQMETTTTKKFIVLRENNRRKTTTIQLNFHIIFPFEFSEFHFNVNFFFQMTKENIIKIEILC